MESRAEAASEGGRTPWKDYILGLAAGVPLALYGLYALMSGSTYLPGLRGGTGTIPGSHGVGAAIMYVGGGLYLLVRFFVHPRVKTEATASQIYLLEIVLLTTFIVSAFYVLWNVGTVAG